MDDRLTILCGDALEKLRELPNESVQCCVTSPPYWGLRDYGTAKWEGGQADCDHRQSDIRMRNNLAAAANVSDGGNRSQSQRADNDLGIPFRDICGKCGAKRIDSQLGLESTAEEYGERLVGIFAEVWRVLRSDGTCWLNLGDSYASTWSCSRRNAVGNEACDYGSRQTRTGNGIKEKDLVGIPWMTAFRLRAAGWYLRQDIIWSKPNPMPESVTDRCTKAHEYIFLLSKRPRYYFDSLAIAEGLAGSSVQRLAQNVEEQTGSFRVPGKTNGTMKAVGGSRKNSFARSGKLATDTHGQKPQFRPEREPIAYNGQRNRRSVWPVATQPFKEAHFATYPPDLVKPCIRAGSQPGDVILDPFAGSGTTGQVALELGRKAILIELNPEYVKLIERRCSTTLGLAL